MVGVKELYVRAEQLVHACGQDFAADELIEESANLQQKACMIMWIKSFS